MNTVDIGVLIVFGISCIAGFMRGFTRETLGLFTWVGSASTTYFVLPLMGGIAREHINNPMIADAVSSIILFIIFLIIFSLISGAISNSVKQSRLGSIDRALGVVFGITRAVVMICCVEIILSTFTLRSQQSETIQQARFTPMIRRGADNLAFWLPHNIREFVAMQQSESLARLPAATPSSPAAPQSMENIIMDAVQDAVAENLAKNQPEHIKDLLNSRATGVQKKSQDLPTAVVVPAPKALEDTQKTAESLANLTPQAMELKGKDGDYDKRQRRALDRLVQINQ